MSHIVRPGHHRLAVVARVHLWHELHDAGIGRRLGLDGSHAAGIVLSGRGSNCGGPTDCRKLPRIPSWPPAAGTEGIDSHQRELLRLQSGFGRPVNPPFGPSSQSKAMRAGISAGAGGTSPPFHSACGVHCGHIGGGGNQSGIADSSVIVIASFGAEEV
jgi:hypothetical protein